MTIWLSQQNEFIIQDTLIKYGKKDDDDDSNYKSQINSGDVNVKTKPSKHTKKFKQMFGEDENESLWDKHS